jgi:hypothetical protein
MPEYEQLLPTGDATLRHYERTFDELTLDNVTLRFTAQRIKL